MHTNLMERKIAVIRAIEYRNYISRMDGLIDCRELAPLSWLLSGLVNHMHNFHRTYSVLLMDFLHA